MRSGGDGRNRASGIAGGTPVHRGTGTQEPGPEPASPKALGFFLANRETVQSP